MSERANRLERALTALGSGWASGTGPAGDTARELRLANALSGAAEAQILSTEIQARTTVEAAALAEPLADRFLIQALPELKPLMVHQFRAGRLERALARAAGGTQEAPDDLALAAARDALTLAALLISYRQSIDWRDEETSQEFLALANAALRSVALRLCHLADPRREE